MSNENENKFDREDELEETVTSPAEEPETPAVPEEKEEEKDLLAKEPNAPKRSFFSSAKFRHGGMATAFTVGFIVVILLLNMVVSILAERFPSINIDITQGNMNTLSESAIEVADSVKLPTTITILGDEEKVMGDLIYGNYGYKYSQVGILAAKLSERNPMITVEYMDLDQNPNYATAFQGETLQTGCVVVQTEKRHRILQVTDLFGMDTNYQTGASTTYSTVDSALAAAISQVNSEKLPVVAFATGHEEMMDMSGFKTALANQDFETVEFNIRTDPIPENTQFIVLATPKTDYTEEELKKFDDFLAEQKEEDRSLLVTFHPTQEELPNLSVFLAEWGLSVPGKTIMDTDTSHLFQNDPSYTLVRTNVDSEISLGSDTTDYGYVAMPVSRPVEILFKSQDGVSTHALAASYDTSFAVDAQTTEMPPPASYNTVAIGQRYFSLNNRSYKQSVIACGSSMAFAGTYINSSAFGNGTFLTDVAKYATGTAGNTTGISISKVQTNVPDITMTASASNMLGLGLFTIVIPLAVLLAGLIVYLKRRHL